MPESSFWFKNGTNHTPVPLLTDRLSKPGIGSKDHGRSHRIRDGNLRAVFAVLREHTGWFFPVLAAIWDTLPSYQRRTISGVT
jgi:hypothetical protein